MTSRANGISCQLSFGTEIEGLSNRFVFDYSHCRINGIQGLIPLILQRQLSKKYVRESLPPVDRQGLSVGIQEFVKFINNLTNFSMPTLHAKFLFTLSDIMKINHHKNF